MADQAGRLATAVAPRQFCAPPHLARIKAAGATTADALLWMLIVVVGAIGLSPFSGLAAARETIAARRDLRARATEMHSKVWTRHARRNAATSAGEYARMKRPNSLLAAILVAGAAFGAAPVLADTRPVVVELFTSQGCSSCPPADALLRELARRGDVIALGFHISYWDRLGWKDPLSNQASTDRQKVYARRLSGRVYTPQIVIEGTTEAIGSDRDAVFGALRVARPAASAPIRFSADRRSLEIGSGSGKGEVVLVRFMRQLSTNVSAGENAGRRLEDANGVTAVTPLGAWDGSARRIDIEPPGVGEGLAVLVQAPDGVMLGAAIALGPERAADSPRRLPAG